MKNKAKQFAKEKHNKQLDDCGKNYFIEHVCKVVTILGRMQSWGEKRRKQYLRKSKFWKSVK